jgi:hypothetical protein
MRGVETGSTAQVDTNHPSIFRRALPEKDLIPPVMVSHVKTVARSLPSTSQGKKGLKQRSLS